MRGSTAKIGKYIWNSVRRVILFIWLLFALFPIYWLVSNSFKYEKNIATMPPKWIFEPTLANYKNLITGSPRFYLNVLNTVIISSTAAVICILLGSLSSYATVRWRFKGRLVFLISILMTQMIPPIVLIIPIRLLFQTYGLIDTYAGVSLAYIAYSLPFSVWMMRGFFSETSRSLEESAIVEGCTVLGAFFRIAIPLAIPGIITTFIFMFLFNWNEFLFAILLTIVKVKTVSPAIVSFIYDYYISWGLIFAGSTLVIILPLFLSLVLQRYIVRGLTLGALK